MEEKQRQRKRTQHIYFTNETQKLIKEINEFEGGDLKTSQIVRRALKRYHDEVVQR